MQYKITIPKPCHEDWNKFTAAEQGKHCQVCATTVIDFTTWEPNAIANHFATNTNKETCGRFTKSQIERTNLPSAIQFAKQISYFRMSTLKKIAAIFLFAFVIEGSSYASDAIVHGGISAIPSPSINFTPTALKYKIDKPKKKKTKKRNTKGKVKVTEVKSNEDVIMGKMIAPIYDSTRN